MQELTEQRKGLYSQSRKSVGEEKEAVKARLSEITERMKIIRKEVRLCDGVFARSDTIKEKLAFPLVFCSSFKMEYKRMAIFFAPAPVILAATSNPSKLILMMKMDAITDETRLLCRNHIDTAEQLLSYKGSLLFFFICPYGL